MSKPREFWITDAGLGYSEVHDAEPEPNDDLIHVIEYSAYDDCKAELKMRTEKQLKLQAKADKLAEALDEVFKCGPNPSDMFKAKDIAYKALAEYRGSDER